MKITEAREALVKTFESIVSEAEGKGIKAEYKCYTSDRDLIEVEYNDPAAALIAGELIFGAEGTDEKLILECAVSISKEAADDDVSSDELLGEITSMKESIREFYEKIEAEGSVAAALSETCRTPEESKETAPVVHDNKMFYIYGAIIAAVAIIAAIIISAF